MKKIRKIEKQRTKIQQRGKAYKKNEMKWTIYRADTHTQKKNTNLTLINQSKPTEVCGIYPFWWRTLFSCSQFYYYLKEGKKNVSHIFLFFCPLFSFLCCSGCCVIFLFPSLPLVLSIILTWCWLFECVSFLLQYQLWQNESSSFLIWLLCLWSFATTFDALHRWTRKMGL